MKLLFFLAFTILQTIAYANDTATLVVLFSFDKYNLTNIATNKIDSFSYALIRNNLDIKTIAVAGHTDQIGSSIYNKMLSEKRAITVSNYFKNIFQQLHFNIDVNGFGETQLLTTDIDEKAKYKNRRVVVKIVYSNAEETVKPAAVKEDSILPIAVVPKKTIYPKSEKIKEIIKDTAVKVGSTIVLPYILFVGGEHFFLQISYPYLDELLSTMQENKTLEIEIQGHICCAQGADDAVDFSTGKNNLSVARAKAVYDFLVENGIDENRLSYKGFGHQFPLTQERTEEERQRNRRVEIKIIKK